MRLSEYITENQPYRSTDYKIQPKDRIVFTNSPFNKSIKYEQNKKYSGNRKPIGFWYGIGKSWENWADNNEPEWKDNWTHAYKIQIDNKDILVLSNKKEIEDFANQYQMEDDGEKRHYSINWNKVAETYKGVELNPFIKSIDMIWYQIWDVASGCIWDLSAITKSERI